MKNILRKKKDGSVTNYMFLIFLLFLISVLLVATYKGKEITMEKNYIDDGIVSSNLATLVVDLDKYYNNGNYADGIIVIKNPEGTYDKFCEILKINLNLNNNFETIDNRLVDKVVVENLKVYNLDKTSATVTEYNFNSSGTMTTSTYPQASAITPNGIKVDYSCVYSKISFGVKGLFNEKITRTRENAVFVKNKN